MALRAPDVHVVAITTVAGKRPMCSSPLGTALVTRWSLCGADVPVYAGADQNPLERVYENATLVPWLRTGLGEHGYPPPRKSPGKNYTPRDAIIEAVRSNSGLVLITLAPLTNVALALAKRHQDIAKKVSRCVVMGGAPLAAKAM